MPFYVEGGAYNNDMIACTDLSDLDMVLLTGCISYAGAFLLRLRLSSVEGSERTPQGLITAGMMRRLLGRSTVFRMRWRR